jgi:hypothetical protein
LPHRGGVHRIKVPVEVVTLAAVPLPLVPDGDATVLARATTLELSLQIHHSEMVSTVGASAPLVSMSEPLTNLAPYQGSSPAPPSMGQCVDSSDDKLIDVMAPLLCC